MNFYIMFDYLEKLKNIFLIIFSVVSIYLIVLIISHYKEQIDTQSQLETLEKETIDIEEEKKKVFREACLIDLRGFENLEECEKKVYLGNGFLAPIEGLFDFDKISTK